MESGAVDGQADRCRNSLAPAIRKLVGANGQGLSRMEGACAGGSSLRTTAHRHASVQPTMLSGDTDMADGVPPPGRDSDWQRGCGIFPTGEIMDKMNRVSRAPAARPSARNSNKIDRRTFLARG